MAAQYKIIHPVKYYRDFLNHDLRPDGRELDQFRPVVINVDSISTADGSAIVKVGNTTVVCGIKAELAAPLASQPGDGFIVPNVELTPLCSPKYRPGPPSEDAQIVGRVLYDVVANSGCLDLSQLCVARDKLVWVLYCDIICLDHDGCVLDASLIALLAALQKLRLPKVDYNTDTHVYKVDEESWSGIQLKCVPVATSFMIFDDTAVIADPNAEEEQLSFNQVTIAVSEGELCLMHKPGGGPLAPSELETCLKHALAREKDVHALLNSVIKK